MRPDLAALARLSARLGRDPEQVQAAGGNSSLKAAGVLWVKASGFWLADAEREDIFVPVDIERVRQGLAHGTTDPVPGAVRRDLNDKGLRPSIETSLHALMPQRFVIHTHSVRTIAIAVREDRDAILGQRLQGLAWACVPYAMPGLPLTRAIQAVLSRQPVDVLILGNHGLVVAAETLEAAASLLATVERRLDAPVIAGRTLSAPQPPAALPDLVPVAHARAHAPAFDTDATALAVQGSLYPDHVIFLGPAATTSPAPEHASQLHLIAGQGAYLPAGAGRSAHEMALCLALVLQRLPADAPVRYLTAADAAALLNWEAEKYRQSVAKT